MPATGASLVRISRLGEAMDRCGGGLQKFTRRGMLRALSGAGTALILWTSLSTARPTWAQDGGDHHSGAHAVVDRMISYSLASRELGPLPVGGTKSDYGAEIGSSTFADESYVIHINPFKDGLAGRDEWLSRRIGDFSFRDGAVMVDVLDELNPTGKAAYAIEMRRQAYKQRRYIRSNWLWVQPSERHVHIQSDGNWNRMEKLAEDPGTSGAVRDGGQWNTLLFIAQGDHLEGWVNGLKVVEAQDGRWGSGQISLVALRRDREEVRVRFRNLRIWTDVPPDPVTIWGDIEVPVAPPFDEYSPSQEHEH
jgi:hypothetical protein